jgi:hypothetical protein
VVLAKPQVKSKFGRGIRGGYPLGFRGDHRVGTSPGRAGRGCSSGMGTGSYDGTCCSGSDCKISAESYWKPTPLMLSMFSTDICISDRRRM